MQRDLVRHGQDCRRRLRQRENMIEAGPHARLVIEGFVDWHLRDVDAEAGELAEIATQTVACARVEGCRLDLLLRDGTKASVGRFQGEYGKAAMAELGQMA